MMQSESDRILGELKQRQEARRREPVKRGPVSNPTHHRHIRKQLGLSPRQFRKQLKAARRAAKKYGVEL